MNQHLKKKWIMKKAHFSGSKGDACSVATPLSIVKAKLWLQSRGRPMMFHSLASLISAKKLFECAFKTYFHLAIPQQDPIDPR